jgi:hypothetical protein
VFDLFWLFITAHLKLISIGSVFILFYTLIGAARAGELSSEFDYTDDYIADDYPTIGSCPTDSENLLGIAMQCASALL